ncbi:helix-turn-helix domain-containing protein [Candidatus Parcubacteria bacterium]|jgi:TrpR-related protein YerC/YecD|nr:helix-turn-helix domain-containing protein [Candidatus Parcubacteria bacterium]
MQEFKFNKKSDDLFKIILKLKNIKEAEAFFRDLCTISELQEMVDRWRIVRLLSENKSYRDIAKELKTSTTTVSRVASWLKNGKGGYSLALKRSGSHHSNSSSGKGLR